DLIASGVSPEDARRRARLELGGVEAVKERLRDVRSGASLERLLHDLRHAARALKRSPGITLTAVALIAVVIGGNTTIYSIVHAVFSKPAPGVEAHRLVTLDVRQ